MNLKLLAGVVNLGNITGIDNTLGNTALNTRATMLSNFEKFISNMVGALTIIGGIWFIYQIILASLAWISAGGDKQNLQTAQKRLTQSFMGLLITVASFALIGLVGRFLGLDIYSISDLVNNISP